MALFERADSGKRVTWWSILGLVLVPIIIIGGFVLAGAQGSERLSTVKAAIVNNDEGGEVDGQTVPMGRQLAAALVDQNGDNFRWVQSTDEDAEEGLKSGEYAAVVTIPAGFSDAVLSTANEEPAQTSQAEIAVQTSKVSPISDGTIAQALVEAARAEFNTDMTEQFLNGVFVGFNEMGEQFQTMADAASELDKGTGQLADGVSELSDGAGQLADGVNELDANSQPLVDGVSDLGDGASELSDGVGQLDDGMSELSDGLQTMKRNTKNLPDQSQQLADGADDLAGGVDEYTQGVDGVVGQVQDFSEQLADIDVEQLEELGRNFETGNGGTDPSEQLGDVEDFLTGVSDLSDGLATYQDSLREAADDARGSVGSVTRFNQAIEAGLLTQRQAEQLRTQLCGQLPDGTADPACAVVEAAYLNGYFEGLAQGLDQAADGLDQNDPQSGESLIDGADQLAQGAGEVNSQIQDALDQLEALGDLEDFSGLTGDMGDLQNQLEEFQRTTDDFLNGSKQLRDGANELADGTQQFADGMGELSDGIATAADGSRTLADGTGQLADGASQLADGAGQLEDGVRQYTGGVGLIAENMDTFVSGVDQLDTGAGELADGMSTFADGINEGKDQIPSYSATERDQLKTVASNAINDPFDGLRSANLGQFMAVIMMLALWAGSLITYTVVRAVSAKALTSRQGSLVIMSRGLLPGLGVAAVQAVLVTGVAQVLLQLPSYEAAQLFIFAVFAAVVFTVLNFALTALFGSLGRMISMVMIVCAVVVRMFSGVPGALNSVAGSMPPSTGIDGALSIITGAPGLGAAYGSLMLWLLLGLGAAVIAVARKRSLKPSEVGRFA